MQHRSAAAIALLLAIVVASPEASAQSFLLRAHDGETEHQLYVSGLIGIYVVGASGSPFHSRVACGVRIGAPGDPQSLRIVGLIQLGRAPRPACDRAALPRVALTESGDGGTIMAVHGDRATPLSTETVRHGVSFAFPNEREAIGAAASIAQGLGPCGYFDSDASNARPRDHAFYCGGMLISVVANPSGASLSFAHAYEDTLQRHFGRCQSFAEAHDFREAWVSGTDSLCAHGHVLTDGASPEEVARALGACREDAAGGEGDLRCGSYRVHMDRDARTLRVRRASP